jgi:hypothetical protein
MNLIISLPEEAARMYFWMFPYGHIAFLNTALGTYYSFTIIITSTLM